MRKTVLVTGGAGFIGSHIAKRLLEKGYKVKVVDNLATGKLKNISDVLNKIKFIKGDLADLKFTKKAIKDVDFICHQAAIPSVARSIEDPLTTHQANINATLNLLWATKESKKIKKFVFASSSSIYGDSPKLPKKEDFPPNPISPYALAKYTSEKYCELFYELYGLPTVSLRYFNVFGPNQDPKSEYSAAIPKFISLMIKNKRPIVYGDGEQTRDFTDVENVVSANLLALKSKANGVFNIACGKRVSLNQIIALLNKILNKNIKPIYKPKRPGDIKHSLADINKARKLLKYKPKIGIEEGLRKTIDWLKLTN